MGPLNMLIEQLSDVFTLLDEECLNPIIITLICAGLWTKMVSDRILQSREYQKRGTGQPLLYIHYVYFVDSFKVAHVDKPRRQWDYGGMEMR